MLRARAPPIQDEDGVVPRRPAGEPWYSRRPMIGQVFLAAALVAPAALAATSPPPRAELVALAAAAATKAAPSTANPDGDLRLVPAPRSVTMGSGRFALRGEVRIGVGRSHEDDAFAARLLETEIEAASAATARVVEGADVEVVLARDPGLSEAGEEGYRLDVTPGGIRATARTGAGLFYAVQTLRQMIHADGVPAVAIIDRPALRWRGLQDDVSRGPVPTVAALERRIRTAAEYKVNLYALYIEASFAYRSQPLIAPPGGALTAAELSHLSEYARDYHVSLMVQQQSFGHLERLLTWEKYRNLTEVDGGNTLAPANEATYALLDSLYREIAPLTSAPFFHIGGDEPADLGQGRSRAMVQASGFAATYLRHVTRLRDLLQPLGKRTMLWSDVALKFPELLPKLRGDFVVASWEYLAHETYAPWIKPLQDAKVEFFVCPGAVNWNRVFPNLDQALPGIRGFTREGQQGGAVGQLDCVWADNGDALFALAWYPVLFGAAAAWQAGDCDPERFARAFDWAFFRNPGEEMGQAVRRLNSAHALVNGARPTDVTLEVFWLNPARNNLERQLSAMLEPVGVRLRVAEEEAIELVERCRPRVARNADILDAYTFAARRLHTIGTRALAAVKMRELYLQVLQAQDDKTRAPQALAQLTSILGLLTQGRDTAARLKAEHEALWLAENRPYWLNSLRAQYDQDLRAWMDRCDELRAYTVMFRNGRPLPSPEQVGFGP
jgi:hexosaminidase